MNEILLFATAWVDLEGITFKLVSHTEDNKHCMILLICGI